ncbi:MAG: glycoside hydrolase family 97 protein [Acidobacteriota bacterium]
MKKVFFLIFGFVFINFLYSGNYEIFSPDNNIKLVVHSENELTFSVFFKNNKIIDQSKIGMVLDKNRWLGKRSKVLKISRIQKDQKITPVVSNKSSKIRDQYKQLTLFFNKDHGVKFRIFNEGVAYRFFTSFSGNIVVRSEILNVRFPESITTFFPEEESFISHYERPYKKAILNTIKKNRFCSLPLLLDTGKSVKIFFTEADLYDYPAMFLFGTGGNSLKAGFPGFVQEALPNPKRADRSEKIKMSADYIAETSGERLFPWRVFVITDNDRKILENNMVFLLSRPNRIKNHNWIRPGKVAWDWYNANNIYGVDFKSGINTDTYKYYIDFASEFGIEYIILDEGWSVSTTNVLETNPLIDIDELVKYGKQKKVGIILWLLWKPLDQNMAKILDTYKNWGIKGIKVDFMQRADQYMVNYYERVAEESAKRHLLVNFHGAFKPAGLRRAYPNILSFEGVKGNENNKWSDLITPEHNVTIPFIRMVAGPMDYTPGAMVNAQRPNFNISFNRPSSLGTRCHQVAMYIIYESPLQMLCDSPSNYYKERETTEFIAKIPTVWDETIVLDAKVSDYVLIARRSGEKWFVGAMTDWTERELKIDFSFLPDGKYNMELIKDGSNASRYAQDYKIEISDINRKTKMKIKLAPGGGWAAIISKSQNI